MVIFCQLYIAMFNMHRKLEKLFSFHFLQNLLSNLKKKIAAICKEIEIGKISHS